MAGYTGVLAARPLPLTTDCVRRFPWVSYVQLQPHCGPPVPARPPLQHAGGLIVVEGLIPIMFGPQHLRLRGIHERVMARPLGMARKTRD